jgi:alpha-1,3/alpha-1,6-mannosyltransferase
MGGNGESKSEDVDDDNKQKPKSDPLHVVFIHLDLGIGGAEQLVLQLATASQELGHIVDIVTSRCDPDHCFDSVKKPTGRLSNRVHLYGTWIPPNVAGVGTALCSTMRMLYLAYQVTRKQGPFAATADVVVLDVLPTAIPLLLSWLPSAGVLFYCHFPDKLLLRNTADVTTSNITNAGSRSGVASWAKQCYRHVLDSMEEQTMNATDTLVVNSKFTLSQVLRVFPALLTKESTVLYPALDTSAMVKPINQPKTDQSPIVSLNRFERKKNIGLVIQAYSLLKQQQSINEETSNKPLPALIIAGGYDTQNVENVEYRGELQTLVDHLGIQEHVQFFLDISDTQRATLFQTALCVVYTPHQEHFGIVPLEAMYAGTPVVAVQSGGPLETVVNAKTGYLCENRPEAFAEALRLLWHDPAKATAMGRAGRIHVEQTFGPDRFRSEWKELVEQTSLKRRQRIPQTWSLWANTTLYFAEALLAFLLLLVVTWILRGAGFLAPTQSLGGAFRQHVLRGGDEL